MNYFTTDLYETKREIVNFDKIIFNGLSKPQQKFVMDMYFNLASSKSDLLSEIERSLHENIRFINTGDRLSNRLESFSDDEMDILRKNHNKMVLKAIDDDNPMIVFDDSEIVKKYGKKFENLCRVRDGSSIKK